MGTYEVDTKKIILNPFLNGVSQHREQCHFIWNGILTVKSARKIEMQKCRSDGQMISTSPRLNGLQLRQQSFCKIMDPFTWNYVLENCLEEAEEVEDLSNDKDESVASSPELLPKFSVPCTFSVAAITLVRATLVDSNIFTRYPHIF
jgi:hypothetical protein